MRKVYLDSNATTMTHPDVVDAMLPFFSERYGNASSVHSFGREAKKDLEKARQRVAAIINAESADEIVFTSGGTEADNHAIIGAAEALKEKGKHIITSSVEHNAVLNACRFLERRGYKVTYLGVDEYGLVDPGEVRANIKEDTTLISVMTANNETGTIMPVDEIGRIADEKGVVFHTDAVQAAGKVRVDLRETGAHLASLSAHKIYGPKGVGALYIRKGTRIEPVAYGGHQEKGRRPGTENIPGIVGFGKACEIALSGISGHAEKIKHLRDMLHDRIKREIGGIKLNGHPEKRLPNTLNVSFENLEGESITLGLDLEGIAVSTGSACTSGSLEPSHVLKSMKVEPPFLQGSVRFSFSAFNTEEEVIYVAGKLPAIIDRLRKISPARKPA
jgi:cysteine desulfurase